MHYVRLSINALCQVMFFFFYSCVCIAARQMGFEDADEVPELCILAQEYLKKSKGCDESIFEYISSGNVENTDSLYAKLVEELERCILSYLAFHWNQATSVISQVC